MRLLLRTFGCKLNQYDSEVLLTNFRSAGYTVTDDIMSANVFVVNTCAVTAEAERKARAAIRGLRRRNRSARLVVTGCMAERDPAGVASIPGVDAVIGNVEKNRITDILNETAGSSPVIRVGETARANEWTDHTVVAGLLDRTRAHLKIQDGCSQKCTYCIIPRLRGVGRSLPPAEAIRKALVLADQGFSEVVLTGVALGTYGFDLGIEDGLADFLAQLEQVGSFSRIRLGSVEPWAISPRLLTVIASSQRICRHLHIPIQSAEDFVLHRMNRRYTVGQIERIFETALALNADWGFGADLIVGFPGETRSRFEATKAFIQDSPLSYLHVFPYSPRPGTAATRLDGEVSQEEKRSRVDELLEIDRMLRNRFRSKAIGTVKRVLFENRQNGALWAGHTDTYLDVLASSPVSPKGRLLDVTIRDIHNDGVVGDIIQQQE